MVFLWMHSFFHGRCKLAEGTGHGMDPTFNLESTGLLQIASNVLALRGFDIFSPLSERHGSWEITYHRLVGSIHCTLSIDFTNEFPPEIEDFARPWRVEVWVGAEKEDHFFRRMVQQFTARAFELKSGIFHDQFKQTLVRSVELVLQLKAPDLIAPYGKRRFEPGERHIDASDEHLAPPKEQA